MGGARCTAGYCLSSRYCIHTVGPQIQPLGRAPTLEEANQLASCYRSVLNVASEAVCVVILCSCKIYIEWLKFFVLNGIFQIINNKH